jgi:hypothetical protein
MREHAPLRAVEALSREIGHLIGKACPPGYGFLLVMFSFGEGGFTNYISNAEREDVVRLLDELRAKLAAGDEGAPPGVLDRDN